jgi:hypothetical protein
MSNGVDGKGADDWPKVRHAIDDFTAVLHTLQRQQQGDGLEAAATYRRADDTDTPGDASSTGNLQGDLENKLVDGLFSVLS